jgi:hypothetical protein
VIQKLGAPLILTGYFVEGKLGRTGLTVTVDVQERPNGGAANTFLSGQTAIDAGLGFYDYEVASSSVKVNGMYRGVFKTTTNTVDQQHVPSAWLTPVWLNTLGLPAVSFVNPMMADGTLDLVRGDDYFAADGMSLDFAVTGLPYSFVGATSVKLTLKHRSSGQVVTFTGSVLSATSLRFELASATTSQLVANSNSGLGPAAYTYDVEVTLANGHKETPLIGKANVREGIS